MCTALLCIFQWGARHVMLPYGRARFPDPGKNISYKRLPTPCTGVTGVSQLLLALPKAFPDRYISYYSCCLIPSVPILQGAELANFLTLPRGLHTLIETCARTLHTLLAIN